MDQIENDALWNDPECLGKLTFALSKLAARTYRNPRPDDIQRKKENEAFFLKVSERCIELEPYRSMHKSTLAYFLYDRYKKESRQEDFDRAKELYSAMLLRGYNGDFPLSRKSESGTDSYIYLSAWIAVFILLRTVNLPVLIGSLFVG